MSLEASVLTLVGCTMVPQDVHLLISRTCDCYLRWQTLQRLIN